MADLKTYADGELLYAATARCPCGAGLAYPPKGEPSGVFKYWDYWDCSNILKGCADATVTHTAQLPFSTYKVKSEGQPSSGGATTRPKATNG